MTFLNECTPVYFCSLGVTLQIDCMSHWTLRLCKYHGDHRALHVLLSPSLTVSLHISLELEIIFFPSSPPKFHILMTWLTITMVRNQPLYLCSDFLTYFAAMDFCQVILETMVHARIQTYTCTCTCTCTHGSGHAKTDSGD